MGSFWIILSREVLCLYLFLKKILWIVEKSMDLKSKIGGIEIIGGIRDGEKWINLINNLKYSWNIDIWWWFGYGRKRKEYFKDNLGLWFE